MNKSSLRSANASKGAAHLAKKPLPSRRDFLQRLTAGVCASAYLSRRTATANAQPVISGREGNAVRPAKTGSDVGSLFPFIQSQAVKSDFPLSFLNPKFKSYQGWKPKGRGKLLELLHYAPPPCKPQPEIVERIDKGNYLREKIYFNTTPDIRLPAYLLIPKHGKLPAPAIVALHDHGGFYFWGKEKLVETENEHPVLTDFKRLYYGGRSLATEPVRQGYVVLVTDMFYWGERRMLLDDDPPDWRERPNDIKAARISAFHPRSGQSEQLARRTIFSRSEERRVGKECK